MRDVQEVAEVVEETLRLPMECLVESARGVADRKASMLLDAENGKPVEAEGVVGPVVEIAKLTVCRMLEIWRRRGVQISYLKVLLTSLN